MYEPTPPACTPAQREWLGIVDEAYWSADDDSDNESNEVVRKDEDGDIEMVVNTSAEIVDGIDHGYIRDILAYWASVTGVELEKLIHTTYRVVESDVGKDRGGEGNEMERVSALAVAQGGGW